MKRLAIVTTHPIQYYAPVFQLMAEKIALKVFYTGGNKGFNDYDRKFGKQVCWDIPLLEGYEYEFLDNISLFPGSHHFFGVVNSNAVTRIKKFEPSAILIYGWACLSHINLLRSFHGKIQILFRGDSKLVDDLPFFRSLVKSILLKWIYKHVDIALYVGTENRAYFKRFGLKESQLVFAPHAIDNLRFQEDNRIESNELRSTLGIHPVDIVVLFAGKVNDLKNPRILLEAFCQINHPNAHLVIVGSGDSLLDLKNLKASEAAMKIHFLPFQNQQQMPSVYQACDLFCIPTKYPGETWGLAVNEAMAAGKAILCSTQVGSAIDLVCEKNGQVFKSEDLPDLKQKLSHLLKDKSRLTELGENSRKKISTWSIENQVNQTLAHV
jgi:glycosyltransferase involved in cell wall biosynthesis